MVFVDLDADFGLESFVAWLNRDSPSDLPKARLSASGSVFAEGCEILIQSKAGQFVLRADRLEDELLLTRQIVLFSGRSAQIIIVEDEAFLQIVPGEALDGQVSVALDPERFLAAAFSITGSAQLAEPDDFAYDQVVDWAKTVLLGAGERNHLGFASFDRHRLIVHATSRAGFAHLVGRPQGIVDQTRQISTFLGIAHPGFSAALEFRGALDDGTETLLGFIYFYDQPHWRNISNDERAEEKLQLLKRLCTAQTPWLVSDIRNRTVTLKDDGGGWVETFTWKDDKITVRSEFFALPDN